MDLDETLTELQSLIGRRVDVAAQVESGRPLLSLMGTLDAGTAAHTVLEGGDPDTLVFTLREIPFPHGFFILKKSEFIRSDCDDAMVDRVLKIRLEGGGVLTIGTDLPTPPHPADS